MENSDTLSYATVVKKIKALPNVTKMDRWLKAECAQLQYCIQRSSGCHKRHQKDKLIHLWEKHKATMKNAVIWPYRFPKMLNSPWAPLMRWMCTALIDEGYQVMKHSKMECDIPGAIEYDGSKSCDIVVYNHAIDLKLEGRGMIDAKHRWFFKPTIPDKGHLTLDELGYGPYSSITYNKPDFESCDGNDMKGFFETDIKEWIESCSSKWGKFPSQELQEDNYILVLGQTLDDYTITDMYFGDYVKSLIAIVRELSWLKLGVPIVVKLHPFIDKRAGNSKKLEPAIREHLERCGSDVYVYSGPTSVHSFFPKCKAVVVCNSGSGLEAMMHHKPVISYGYPEYHWATYDLRHLCDMDRALRLDWFDPVRSDKYLYWYLRKYCIWDLDSARRRVKELLANG